MNKKTERKNKTNLVVAWPKTPYFTLQQLFTLNSDAKEITLRVRLSKEIEKGAFVEIGCITGEQGRPRKVFAASPVSPETLKAAQAENITLVDESSLSKLSTMTSPVTSLVDKTQSVIV